MLNWYDVRSHRQFHLMITDRYCLVDLYNSLSAEQQTELDTFRQTIRDLPQTHESAEDAWNAYPELPEFVVIPE